MVGRFEFMIRYFTVYLFFISILLSQSRVHINDLVQSGELLLDLNKKPFTGIAYNSSTVSDNKIQESKYLKGLLHGTHKEWWENGSKKLQGRYKSGEKNGRWVGYFENGNIKFETNYKNDIEDGLDTRWHITGGKHSKGAYQNGKKVGKWNYWDEQGGQIHYVCIQTDLGKIIINLFSDIAPMHAESFQIHANTGYFNGTIFHRVVPGFVIQGGDPNTRSSNRRTHGQGGRASAFFGIGDKKDPSTWKIPEEFNSIPHKRGIVSMARGSDVNSAGSQFFICVKDAPNLDGRYTVFGEVIEGMEIVDNIVNSRADLRDNPIERISMEVTICN